MVGDILIDFKNIWGFSGMENFLKLSIFTSIFRNQQELIRCLNGLGFLTDASYDKVKIVKRIGNRRAERKYVDVTNDIVYNRALDFLSVASLRTFFHKNRNFLEAVSEILEECRKQTVDLNTAFEVKIKDLQYQASKSTGEELEELYLEIEKRKNSQKNFKANIRNIDALKVLIENMRQSDWLFDKERELEYIDRLDTFVTNEIYYVNGRHKTLNERGLVRLALTVSRVASTHAELVNPFMTDSNSKVRLELLRAVRNAMDFVICQVDEPKQIDSDGIDVDTDIEPDSFMFLEEEDYRLPESPTNSQKECHEDALEGLRFKKKDYQ